MPVNQQITTQEGDRRLTETKRHNLANEGLGAQRNKISASKGSQGRAQTDLEFFKEVGSIPPEKRKQAQKDFYRKYTEGVKKSSSGGVAIPPEDRKRVVKGKRVSGRVDLGGRRIIKKKKKKDKHTKK